jgi:hypothetical protein
MQGTSQMKRLERTYNPFGIANTHIHIPFNFVIILCALYKIQHKQDANCLSDPTTVIPATMVWPHDGFSL